jgi:hypothetical protein
VWDTVEPFANFVTQEDESLGAARSSLDEIESELVELQNAVDRDAGASESP